MKKLAVMIVALTAFLSFSSFGFAQDAMTNSEINNPKQTDVSKPVKKARRAKVSKPRKAHQPRHKKIRPFKKKTEELTQPEKTNP